MERFRGILAALVSLCLLSPSAPVLAQPQPPPIPAKQDRKPVRKPYQSPQLQGDLRIIHALNRFTFGPRPEDIDAVRAVGLDKWFDQQSHPTTIDQSDLQARLTQFPAMQLDSTNLLYRLPSNAIIRQVADGKAPMPQGGLHVIYKNELARYQIRQLNKAQKNQQQASAAPVAGIAPAAGAMAMQPDSNAQTTATTMAPESTQNAMSPADTAAPPPDPAQIDRIAALPPQQRLARLAAMSQPDYDNLVKALKGPQRKALATDLDPAQKEFLVALASPQRVVNEELAAQRLTRDIYSNAQLQEVMTDFWLNHFNVYLHKNEETPYYLVSYERDVIRPRALGKFEDLLEATAHSPAMLLYLDNASSIGPDSTAAERAKMAAARQVNAPKKAPEGLNENYARELMELHTLGVNGGYTQADVTQVARVLTGWGVDRPQRGGGFKFDENRHEPGTKKVLGKKIKEHGELEGEQLLHMLATNPSTARFISRKLAIRFVGDDPPQALVDRMAKSWLSSRGDIPAVLKTLFNSPEFWSADAYRAKVKTPLEYIVSAARASGASTDNLQPFITALRDMGMPLYGAVPPTGYNWQSSTWISTGALVNRMNFALAIAANRLPGITVTWSAAPVTGTFVQPNNSALPASNAASLVRAGVTTSGPNSVPSSQAEEQRLESMLVTGGLSPSTRTALLDQFQAQAAAQNIPATLQNSAAARPLNRAQATAALEKQDQLLAGLLLGSPEFQRR